MTPCRILITRAEPEAHENAAMIVAAGAEPVVIPLRRGHAVQGPVPPRPAILVATSANGLRLGPEFPPDWHDCHVIAVGDRTADAARAAGFGTITSASGDVASLLPVLAAMPSGTRIVYLAGEPRKPDIEDFAAQQDLDLVPWLRYRMVDVEVLPEALALALARRDIDAVLHFSAESARTYLSLAQKANLLVDALRPVHACLSEAIAECLRQEAGRTGLTVPSIVISPTRRGASLVARAIDACHTKGGRGQP